MLSPEEKTRYSRQSLLPQLGLHGQEKLKDASVLLIGAGALGSPAALYLAAAGVGTLAIVDDDLVSLSNLHRQILHDTPSIGNSKLDSARARLLALNPHLNLICHHERFTAQNALDLLRPHDLIVDGSDNFPTRFATNDAAFFLKKPLIHAAIFQFEGQMTVFAPHLGGPCYRCLLPEPPAAGTVPSCAEAGVLGVLPGVMGSLQGMEAIKLLLGIGQAPLGRLIHYQALSSRFREIKLKPDPHCALCSPTATITSPVHYETQACLMSEFQEITTTELREILAANDPNVVLLDVREQEEYDLEHIPGSRLIPLSTWPEAVINLPKEPQYLIHCAKGMRSARACEFLLAKGYENVKNVAGGIGAW